MTVLYPWLLLLLVPVLIGWWHWRWRRPGALVALLALLLVGLALSQPQWRHGSGGSDVVVVLDRSRSMADALPLQQELVELIGRQRGPDDRLGVVVVGERAEVLQVPSQRGLPLNLAEVDPGLDGSDVAGGLQLAHALIPAHRSGRVVLHSDGEFTTFDPSAVVASLALSGIPVDVLAEQRVGADPAVVAIELPPDLRLGESFIGSLRLIGDRQEQRAWRILRDGQLIAQGSADLRPDGETVLTFADRPSRSGLAEYVAELDDQQDARPGNNRATAALRVQGGERVLLISGDGSPGNVAAALQAAGVEVRLRREGPLRLADLSSFQAVILDNVPHGVLGDQGAQALAHWTRYQGGGLVVLGGRRAFGGGGYLHSPLNEVLPVSSELRDEHRQLATALALTMDRSGSMAATTADGRTKMDLANEGVIAAIDLLSPRDSVAVHAVDSEVHVIVPMTPVSERQSIIAKVRGIESMGGGIFVYPALVAAGRELTQVSTGTRHLVLFSDAADSEEPREYRRLLAQYTAVGITVSVIALGDQGDADARLLEDIARLGNGRIVFTQRAEEVPQLFAQETTLVSHSTWIGDPVTIQPQAALSEILGPLHPVGEWPTVGGYNLTYAKDQAQVLAWAAGDPQAPALASWRIGTGRSVALGLAIDDPRDTSLRQWADFPSLLAGMVRWASRGADDESGTLEVRRQGQIAHLRLLLDPAQRHRWPTAPQAQLLGPGAGRQQPQLVSLRPVEDGVWEGHFTLDRPGLILPSVALSDDGQRQRVLHGAALQLPYSPEDEPRSAANAARDLLALLTRVSGGQVRHDVSGLFANVPSHGRTRDLAPWLVIAALLLLLLEVVLRRLDWHLWRGWQSWPWWSWLNPLRWVAALWARFARGRRPRLRPATTLPAAQPKPPATDSETDPAVANPAPPPPMPASPSAEDGDGGLQEALRRAKSRRRP